MEENEKPTMIDEDLLDRLAEIATSVTNSFQAVATMAEDIKHWQEYYNDLRNDLNRALKEKVEAHKTSDVLRDVVEERLKSEEVLIAAIAECAGIPSDGMRLSYQDALDILKELKIKLTEKPQTLKVSATDNTDAKTAIGNLREMGHMAWRIGSKEDAEKLWKASDLIESIQAWIASAPVRPEIMRGEVTK